MAVLYEETFLADGLKVQGKGGSVEVVCAARCAMVKIVFAKMKDFIERASFFKFNI